MLQIKKSEFRKRKVTLRGYSCLNEPRWDLAIMVPPYYYRGWKMAAFFLGIFLGGGGGILGGNYMIAFYGEKR